MTWLFIISAATAIGCGLIAGFFLTFSDFLMRSLSLSKPSTGIEVMQIINVEVWEFMRISTCLAPPCPIFWQDQALISSAFLAFLTSSISR